MAFIASAQSAESPYRPLPGHCQTTQLAVPFSLAGTRIGYIGRAARESSSACDRAKRQPLNIPYGDNATAPHRIPARRQRSRLRGLCLIAWLLNTGCSMPLVGSQASRWLADYDAAESAMHESGRPLLIVFKNNRKGAPDSVEAVLRSERFADFSDRCVCCVLQRSYEPDRRYVAQFGVRRAPALIVVHTDGTYHARSGALSAQEVKEFLAQAKPPGAKPRINPLIPREPRYAWYDTLAEAKTVASKTNRSMLIVYHRALTDDWPRLEKLLRRREVFVRVGDMVHGRVATVNLWSDKQETPFGTLRLPCIVIVLADGTYESLERPTSYERIVRFLDSVDRDAGPSNDAARASAQP